MDFEYEFEKMKKYEKIYGYFRVISFVLFITFFIISFFTFYGTLLMIFSIILLAIATALIFSNRAQFKEKIIPTVLNDNNLEFLCLDNQMNALVEKSEIFKGKFTQKLETNDIICGTYRNVRFKSFDTSIYKRDLPFKKYFGKEFEKLFKGRFYQISNVHNIKNRIVIRDKSTNLSGPNYELIPTNNEPFNNNFDLLIKYPEKKELLSIEFVEELIKIKEKSNGLFYISLINGTIFVAIDNDIDSYELESIDSIKEISDAYSKDLNLVMEINKAIRKLHLEDLYSGKEI